MKSWGINKTARFPGRIVHAIPTTLFHRNSCRPFRKIVHEYFMTLLPVARVFRSIIRIKFFLSLPTLCYILRTLIDCIAFSKKCNSIILSIISPKGSYSTRRITLNYFAFTLRSPRVIFPLDVNTTGRKYYSLKMIVPKCSIPLRRGTEYRERNSLKLQTFLHSTFDDRYRFSS